MSEDLRLNQIEPIRHDLPSLIDRAAKALAGARSAAEVLEAREAATVAYEAAKLSARMASAKKAHDDVIDAARRVQADALEIQAKADTRLADEYDAAQERGEVATRADGPAIRDHVPERNKVPPAKIIDFGLTRKAIHAARQIRDAEKAKPGIVRKTLDERLKAGEEPSKASLRRAIRAVLPPTPASLARSFESFERYSPPPRPVLHARIVSRVRRLCIDIDKISPAEFLQAERDAGSMRFEERLGETFRRAQQLNEWLDGLLQSPEAAEWLATKGDNQEVVVEADDISRFLRREAGENPT